MKRVVILGAGPSGLSTAWQLSDRKVRDEYEVTIYQMGWRAGGQCATGRVGSSQWINQNGTHYIFGCYDNALTLMRDAYAELDRQGDTRFGTFQDQLVPRNLIVLRQLFNNTWYEWPIQIPTNPKTPGLDIGLTLPHKSVFVLLERLLAYLGKQTVRKMAGLPPSPPTKVEQEAEALLNVLQRAKTAASRQISWSADLAMRFLARTAVHYIEEDMPRWLKPIVVGALEVVRAFWRIVLEVPAKVDVHAARLLMLADMGLTVCIGALKDDAYTPKGMEALDDWEWTEWIRHHGALQSTLDGPVVRVWYDAIAAFRSGNIEDPCAAAGATLTCLVQLIMDYKGSVAYQLKNEIGDSFIGPVVAALRYRGVKFRYFHRVWDIVPDADGKIASVVLERQAVVHGGDDAYDPFQTGVDGHRLVWPDEPNWDQLESWAGDKGQTLWQTLYQPKPGQPSIPYPSDPLNERADPAMDSYFRARVGPTVTLNAGTDFDVVVTAMRHTMYPTSAPSLLAYSKGFETAVEKVGATQTQSLRIWFAKDLDQLGWCLGAPILSANARPFGTWEDPTPVLGLEAWPQDKPPKAVSHLFGALLFDEGNPPPIDHVDYPFRQGMQAQIDASAWTQYITGTLWPGACRDSSPLTLWGGTVTALQIRANAGPAEEYTMIYPKTAQYRLTASGTGVQGLIVAGDWTKTFLLTGSFEGAVASGVTAAEAAQDYLAD